VTTDAYVLPHGPTAGGDLDPSRLRGCAIADAHARFRRQRGDDVLFTLVLDTPAARDQLEALAVGADWDRALATGDPAIERWAQWLLGKLEEAGRAEQRDDGWRLRSTALHEESERRLGELSGWSDAAIAGQRELLRHVDAPADEGDEMEQSLSKLAAAGWKIEAKGTKAKKEPDVHFAAGDLPLARAADWREPGAIHPRLAAALAPFLLTLAPDERAEALPGHADLGRWLPAAQTVAGPDSAAALLDVRTVTKALRDAGGLDLPEGEPLGPVLLHGPLRFEGAVSTNGTVGAARSATRSVAELIDAHGADAVRFALLHAAAPAKAFAGGDDVVGYSARFLDELRSFAEPRLEGASARIDLDDGLRRRLAGWCDTAVGKVAENYERLDPHRATRNVVELLTRIQDFERRVTEHRGEVAGADRAAAGAALTVLVQLIAPIAPRPAGELWAATGRDGSVESAGWPGLQREPATA
jgi:leucyl-tRNA synthetase